MNFVLDEEQEQLRTMVRDFLADRSPESEVRRLMETPEGFDPAVWAQLSGELGLTGLAIPEEYGGAGYGFVEVGIVLEEAGRALLCAPYFSSAVLAATTLLECGDETAKKDYLPGIAGGELRATLAVTEESGGWEPDAVEVVAAESGGAWVLTGSKSYVLDGTTADLLLVTARTGEGVSLFAVAAEGSGLTRVSLETLDQTRKQAKVTFAGTPGRLIGTAGEASDVLERVLDVAAIGLAAEQVGGASQVLDMSVEYAKIRVQFGRQIGSFQAIKHRCANMLLEVETAKSAAYSGAWAVSTDSAELAMLASLAKAHCSDAYMHCAAENIQIHGGIGFTWEHPAHLHFRRAKSAQLMFGDSTYHRERLAQRIGITAEATAGLVQG
jgi:alkylation response protein AidB-like acyl-CoA dehydrogenase